MMVSSARRKKRRFESVPMKAPDGNHIEFFEMRETRGPREIELPAPGMPASEDPHEVWTEWVRVSTPGERKNIPEFPLTDERRERYRIEHEKWRAWVASGGDTPLQDGIPLVEWDGISLDEAETLETSGIVTVEQLASIADQNLGAFAPGIRRKRERAQEYLREKQRSDPINELRKQIPGMIAEAVAAALAAQNGHSANGKSKPKRGRSSRKASENGIAGVAEASETPPAADSWGT